MTTHLRVTTSEPSTLLVQVTTTRGAKVGGVQRVALPLGPSWLLWGGAVGRRVLPSGCYRLQLRLQDASRNLGSIRHQSICLRA